MEVMCLAKQDLLARIQQLKGKHPDFEDYSHTSLGCMTSYEYERWFHASAA